MKNLEPILIIIDQQSDIPVIVKEFQQFKMKFFISDDVQTFKQTIAYLYKLNPETPVIILIHAQQYMDNPLLKGGESKLKGIDVKRTLEKNFPGIKSYLFTRSEDYNLPDGKYLTINISNAIQSGEIESQAIRKMIPNIELKSKIFNYDDDNDWKNRGLRFIIDDKELKEIIGETLHSDAEDIEVNTITPGLSGAFVLKLKFQHEHQTKFRLLKIDKNLSLIENEKNASELLRSENINTDKFLIAIEKGTKKIRDWSCLLFDFKGSSETLREYLIKKFDSDSKEILGSVINNVINSFYKNFLCHGRHTTKTNIWRGSNEYSGLIFSDDYRATIIKNILNLNNFITEIELHDEVKDDSIQGLLNFIENSKYKQNYLDSKNTDTLLSRVHGDFNSGNILVNSSDGLNPSFIDFSNMSIVPNSNALLDIAKLSVDFEKYLIKDSVLFNNEIKIKDWVSIHQKYLSENFEIEGDTKLDKLYQLVKVLFDFSLKVYEDSKMVFKDSNLNVENARENFIYIRLHYLLRCLSNPYLIIHKKVFALIASIQILEILYAKSLKL